MEQQSAIADVTNVTGNLKLDLDLQPGQKLPFTITRRDDGSARIGVIDVSHRSPTVRGNGTPTISWSESLIWGPNPTSPGDSWQKVVTLKNHSRSVQPVTFRYINLDH